MGADVEDARAAYDSMQNSMEPCMAAFSQGDADEFEKCLDPEVVMYTPHGEFVGRQQVIGYLQNRFFQYAPNVHHTFKVNEVQMIGDALWYSNTFSIRPLSTAAATACPYAARAMADGASSTCTIPRSRQMRLKRRNPTRNVKLVSRHQECKLPGRRCHSAVASAYLSGCLSNVCLQPAQQK
jgi:hypothetical protein